MCGRYVLDKPIDVIEKRFMAGTKGKFEWHERYNVAPSQTLPVVTKPRLLEFVRWGYAPAWAKKAVINARVESFEKSFYRDARRCLVPATGFYEWKREGTKKTPYFIYLPDHTLFAFAGLCGENGYAIVTREAIGPVRDLHARMPLILQTDDEEAWLTGAHVEQGVTEVAFHSVSPAVNTPARDDAHVLEPMS